MGFAQSRAVGEVKDKLKQSGNWLSGGQQQRLCIARAVANKPEVVLLDEPHFRTRPISTAHIEELVTELKKDYTIAMVTHNMQQAARVSDFTAYMYLGELIEVDRTEKVFKNPRAKKPKITSPANSVDGFCSQSMVNFAKRPSECFSDGLLAI